jgi:hypothetical protein
VSEYNDTQHGLESNSSFDVRPTPGPTVELWRWLAHSLYLLCQKSTTSSYAEFTTHHI